MPPKENEKSAACTPYRRRESAEDRFKYNVNLDTEAEGRATPSITKASSLKRKRAEDDGDTDNSDWILEAPATNSRAKKVLSQISKVDLSSKVANRQRDAESKARTTVKKSPQKSMTRSPVIKTPPSPKPATTSKIDGQVGKPSIRPTPSMAVQPSGSALPQSRSPIVLSAGSGITPPLQAAGRPSPSRMRDSQPLRARISDSRTISWQEAVNGGTSSMNLSGENRGYGPRSYRQDQSTVVVTCNPQGLQTKVSRNPPNVGGSPSLGAHPISPVLPHFKRHDTRGGMAPHTQRAYTGARDAKQTRKPSTLQRFGPSSS